MQQANHLAMVVQLLLQGTDALGRQSQFAGSPGRDRLACRRGFSSSQSGARLLALKFE